MRWKCEGPGRPVAVLPVQGRGGRPNVLFQVARPELTLCRQALDVSPDGINDALPPPTGQDYGPPPEDPWLRAPLPWVKAGRERAAYAVTPAVVCLALLLVWGWRGRWRDACCLLLTLAALALATAQWQLFLKRGSGLQNFLVLIFLLLYGPLLFYSLVRLTSRLGSKVMPRYPRKGWGAVPGSLLCVLVSVALVAHAEGSRPDYRKAGEQYYAPDGWYWIGPYVLSAGGRFTLLAPVVWVVGAAIFLSLRDWWEKVGPNPPSVSPGIAPNPLFCGIPPPA
jgi:hypothetical protein